MLVASRHHAVLTSSLGPLVLEAMLINHCSDVYSQEEVRARKELWLTQYGPTFQLCKEG